MSNMFLRRLASGKRDWTALRTSSLSLSSSWATEFPTSLCRLFSLFSLNSSEIRTREIYEHHASFATDSTSLASTDLKERAIEVATTESQDSPEIVLPGQAALGDYRSTSGVGLGDGIGNHTAKWLQPGRGGQETSPLEFIQSSEPIKVDGLVVASHGSDDPALGCPVEYISLKGTTRENPAVCKYTGYKYYSDAWKEGGAH